MYRSLQLARRTPVFATVYQPPKPRRRRSSGPSHRRASPERGTRRAARHQAKEAARIAPVAWASTTYAASRVAAAAARPETVDTTSARVDARSTSS